MAKQPNKCSTYDFTIPKENIEKNELINKLRTLCDKWVFQLEKGTKTEYLHWKGRVHTKIRTRITNLIKNNITPSCHWSITSNNSKGNWFYVTKTETRIEGPYRS